jgi:hypothetical protein
MISVGSVFSVLKFHPRGDGCGADREDGCAG